MPNVPESRIPILPNRSPNICISVLADAAVALFDSAPFEPVFPVSAFALDLVDGNHSSTFCLISFNIPSKPSMSCFFTEVIACPIVMSPTTACSKLAAALLTPVTNAVTAGTTFGNASVVILFNAFVIRADSSVIIVTPVVNTSVVPLSFSALA